MSNVRFEKLKKEMATLNKQIINEKTKRLSIAKQLKDEARKSAAIGPALDRAFFSRPSSMRPALRTVTMKPCGNFAACASLLRETAYQYAVNLGKTPSLGSDLLLRKALSIQPRGGVKKTTKKRTTKKRTKKRTTNKRTPKKKTSR